MRRRLLCLGVVTKGRGRRHPGCQSTNHIECYGVLWPCVACGKVVCCAEGTDDDPDVCDDCWVQTHEPAWWRAVERRKMMQITAKMQAVITQMLEQHGIDGNEVEAFLWLALPERTERLIIERIDARYLSVALAHPEGNGYFTLVPEVFFTTDALGWRPIHLDGSERVTDLTSFVEAWAERILAEGWLTQAEKLPEPPWQVDQAALWASGCDDDGPACEAWEEDEQCDIPF